jgi:hypothetical protein
MGFKIKQSPEFTIDFISVIFPIRIPYNITTPSIVLTSL